MLYHSGSANVGEIQEFQAEVEIVKKDVASLHVDVEQQTSKVSRNYSENKMCTDTFTANTVVMFIWIKNVEIKSQDHQRYTLSLLVY